MNLNYRLKRVARDLKAKYPCPVCDGKGKWVPSFLKENEPIPPDPPGCKGCGVVHRMIVRYVKMPLIAERYRC